MAWAPTRTRNAHIRSENDGRGPGEFPELRPDDRAGRCALPDVEARRQCRPRAGYQPEGHLLPHVGSGKGSLPYLTLSGTPEKQKPTPARWPAFFFS